MDLGRRIGRLFETLSDHQHDRLAGVVDAVVLHRQQHLDQAALARQLDALHLVGQRLELRHGGRGDHRDDARQRLRLRRIDRRDAAARNGAADHHAMDEAVRPVFGGEARAARDLQPSVDTRQRLADAARLERGVLLVEQRFKHERIPVQ